VPVFFCVNMEAGASHIAEHIADATPIWHR
jgi:hypothetical protein